MAKKLISISILLFLCFNSIIIAQDFQYFERNMAENNKVFGLNINQNFATNTLTSGFVLNFVKGNFISDQQKDNCIVNFKNNDLLVGERLNLSLNYQTRLGTGNNYLFFEAGENLFYESKMNRDIFILLFKGNKSFEDTTASLNPFSIRSMQYLYLKGGLHRITDKYSFKFNIAFVGGQRLLDLKTERGGLFTAVDGKYLDLNLLLRSYDVNPQRNSFLNISGSGILTDLMFTHNISENAEIGFGIEGLGVINWTNNVKKRVVDTMYHFEGENISNILDSFSIAVKNVQDLKSGFIKETENEMRQTILPYIAYAQYSQFIIPKVLQLQIKYGIIKSDFTTPFINSAINLFLTEHKLIGLNVNAGGYGNLNIGGHFAVCFSDKSSLQVYFNSISNLIIPSGEMNFTGGFIYRRAIE